MLTACKIHIYINKTQQEEKTRERIKTRNMKNTNFIRDLSSAQQPQYSGYNLIIQI